jgi:heterodisulfide reductase subunit C
MELASTMPEPSSLAEAPPIRPDPAFLAAVEERSGAPVSRCYQCRKCTNGCPLAFAMDAKPNQIMRLVQLGLADEALGCGTIWICASCQTCTTRCPNDIDIAHLMDSLRQLSRERGVTAKEEKVVEFHDAFLRSVRRHGRVFEAGMAARYKLATKDFLGDTKVAWEMLKRGKLKFLPANIKGRRKVREMFDQQRKG